VTVASLVAALGTAVLLHLQIQRRGRALAGALEEALRGEGAGAEAGRDEFARAFELAGLLGRELTRARSESEEARRRLEEEARRGVGSNEALETDLRLAAQLRGLAGVFMAAAHDLKAPLNALALNVELLRAALGREADSAPPTRAKVDRYLSVLEREIGQIDRALTTVLTQALPGSGEEVAFDLRELVEELGRLLGPQARRQRVELATSVPAEPLLAQGFRDRLKQALLNLAVNGLEAMPEGGRLAIVAAGEDGRARILVRDSGPGIPPEVVPRIFDLHFTTKSNGTGLGLHVARSVLRSFGGDIRVETDVGRGTTFTLELPLAAEEGGSHAARAPG
jgi:signal transduction histidine kinase